jgi:hypothetical protein
MRFAIVENGVVTNVVVADAPAASNWIQTDQAGPSWLYNGSTFSPPPPPVPTATEVRTERDKLLGSSDWTQVADAPVDQAAWAEYRQALRDVPEQEGFPENVVWPTKPETNT